MGISVGDAWRAAFHELSSLMREVSAGQATMSAANALASVRLSGAPHACPSFGVPVFAQMCWRCGVWSLVSGVVAGGGDVIGEAVDDSPGTGATPSALSVSMY